MRKGTKAALVAAIGVLGLTAGGAAQANTAQAAEGRYNIMIATVDAGFVADYCLLTTTSGNGRAACSGNKPTRAQFRLGVPYNPGDKVWIDINVRAGKDRKGIDLRGNHYCEVSGHLLDTNVWCWKNFADSREGGKPGTQIFG
ncbi:hypothetical protein [Nonomuraea lactucae]|uniref:hypothetical protein n=1 Tax=Nonomuraea lactucae TaxID=2249762 RepID=UPI0013B42E49|nr:hypothetical protein [Nonomuraea lactucae]